jgi:hypothetical protein
LEDLGVNEMVNSNMDLQEVRWGKDRLYLAQNRDRWHSLVNAITDCMFYKI